MWPLYTVQGCHWYRTIHNSLDDVDAWCSTILSSTSLSELKVKCSSWSGVSFSMPDKILLVICSFIYATFSGFFRLNTIPWRSKYKLKSSWTFNVDIWSQLYNIALIQWCYNLVPAAVFAAFHFLSSSLFLSHFNLSKVIHHQRSSSQTCVGQYTYEKIQLLSHRLLDLINLFSWNILFIWARGWKSSGSDTDVADSGRQWKSGSLS